MEASINVEVLEQGLRQVTTSITNKVSRGQAFTPTPLGLQSNLSCSQPVGTHINVGRLIHEQQVGPARQGQVPGTASRLQPGLHRRGRVDLVCRRNCPSRLGRDSGLA